MSSARTRHPGPGSRATRARSAPNATSEGGIADLQQAAKTAGGPRYCVYGHTHAFAHEPVGLHADAKELVYLNSGTWRPRVLQTRDQLSFITVKEMTYLAFFSEEEDSLTAVKGGALAKGTSYRTWTGLMMKRPR
jgi:hypothetical protein